MISLVLSCDEPNTFGYFPKNSSFFATSRMSSIFHLMAFSFCQKFLFILSSLKSVCLHNDIRQRYFNNINCELSLLKLMRHLKGVLQKTFAIDYTYAPNTLCLAFWYMSAFILLLRNKELKSPLCLLSWLETMLTLYWPLFTHGWPEHSKT